MLSNIPFDQVESILLHELAHIRRKDHVANALQIAAETILFFNPALLWLSSVIREEREACCDAIAVNELQSSAIYVEALVTFQTYSGSRVHGSLAFAGNKNYLLKRVKRILYNENKKINVMEKIILFAGFAAVCMSPVFFNAKAKPVIHAPMAIVEQVADTLPPSKAESNEEMNPAARRAAKRAEKAAKQAEKAAQQAEKAAEAEEAHQAEVDARVDIQIDTNVNFQIDTNINFNVDQKLSPEVRIQIEKAMKLAEKNVVNSKIALRQVNHQLQQVKLQQTLNSLQMKQQIQQQMQLVNKQMQQLNLKKSLLAEDNELNGIMAFLINKKIITTKENLSFRLDQDALTVNGIKQSESLHSELKEKYISDPGDFYEYKNSGGSTSIGIRRNK
jgi:hypothetical protein